MQKKKLNSQEIINEFKSNYFELNFDIKYQDNIPEKMIGLYDGSPIFVYDFYNKSVSFDGLYDSTAYKKFIQPNILNSEKFLIESSGVNFDYNLHRSLITKLIPKIVLGFKKYYIDVKQEMINEDFQCRT